MYRQEAKKSTSESPTHSNEDHSQDLQRPASHQLRNDNSRAANSSIYNTFTKDNRLTFHLFVKTFMSLDGEAMMSQEASSQCPPTQDAF